MSDPINDGVFYQIGNDGVKEVSITSRRIVGLDAAMREFTKNQSFSLPGAFKVMQIPVNVKIQSNNIFLSAPIPGIQLNTWFVAEKGRMLPTFRAKDTNDQIQRYRWEVPEDMKLIFGVHGVIAPNSYRYQATFLYARHKTEAGYFQLPLPNIHGGSAQICMGSAFKCDVRTAQELYQESLMHFQSSNWNQDLHNHPEQCNKMFSFEQETGKAVPAKNWTSLCERVNNTLFENFV